MNYSYEIGAIFVPFNTTQNQLPYELTKAFQILAKLIELTNSSTEADKSDKIQLVTFEPEKKTDSST